MPQCTTIRFRTSRAPSEGAAARVSRLWSPSAVSRLLACAGVLALGLLAGCRPESPRVTPLDGVVAGTRVCVVSTTSAESRAVADAYAFCRRVPDSHRVTIPIGHTEAVSRAVFERTLLAPIVQWWRDTPPERRPTYLVLCRGVPLRVSGRTDPEGDEASVDSELTLLPRVATGWRPTLSGPFPNPLRAGAWTDSFPPVSAEEAGVVLVTRLDGYRHADAIALVTRAAACRPGSERGLVLVDHRAAGPSAGDSALSRVEAVARAWHLPLRADTTAAFVDSASTLLAYAGWGSNDVAFVRPRGYTWAPGAVVATFVSTSARTFDEPPDRWRPGRFAEREHHFAGSPQSLLGDWIRSGVSGGVGYVSEPWLAGCVAPDVLLAAYASGRTFGESAYLAMPYVSWRAIVVGDPLLTLP